MHEPAEQSNVEPTLGQAQAPNTEPQASLRPKTADQDRPPEPHREPYVDPFSLPWETNF